MSGLPISPYPRPFPHTKRKGEKREAGFVSPTFNEEGLTPLRVESCRSNQHVKYFGRDQPYQFAIKRRGRRDIYPRQPAFPER